MYIVVFQSLSCVQLFATPWTTGYRVPCPSPSPSPQTNVSDAIQSSHPLSSPSPPTLSLFQLQGLFQ